MSEAYFSFGSTLAAQTNIETYTLFPPDFLPDRGGMPVALQGGVSRQLLSGRSIRQGFMNGAMVLDAFQDGHDTLNTLLYALFGGLTIASKRWYFIAPDASGHYAPFQGYIGNPYLGQTAKESVNGIPYDLVFPLTACVLQSLTKTANYTVTTSDHLIYADTSSGSITFALPALSGVTADIVYRFLKTSASNSMILDGNGSETIDLATTLTKTAIYSDVSIIKSGSGWVTI